jgi:hypothetical protein
MSAIPANASSGRGGARAPSAPAPAGPTRALDRSGTLGVGGEFTGPLFVTGMWRSGSSLLYALLNKHPRIGLMYEADLALLRPAFWKPGAAGWAERWEFWNGAVLRHGFEPAALQASAGGGAAARDFKQAFELAYRAHAARKGAAIWGDKSPDLYDRMRLLVHLFPEARFIVVWRSPKATCSSMAAAAAKGASFFRKPAMALRGLLGCAELRRECDRLQAAGHAVCEVDYEELASEPAAVMRRVCEFLGLAYDPNLATLEGADRGAIHPGEHHALLRGSRIVAGSRPEILDAALRAKIGRYITWWRGQHQGVWPKFPPAAEGEGAVPSLFERARDRLAYRAWRSLDALTRLIYCWAPVGWLRWYRTRKAARHSDCQAPPAKREA